MKLRDREVGSLKKGSIAVPGCRKDSSRRLLSGSGKDKDVGDSSSPSAHSVKVSWSRR
jgi:hypothetical protein